MGTQAAVHAVVHGLVQGVFFRAFVQEKAAELGLTGNVRNVPDGTVEVWAEGEKASLEELIRNLKTGPSRARVSGVTVQWSTPTGNYSEFRIKYD